MVTPMIYAVQPEKQVPTSNSVVLEGQIVLEKIRPNHTNYRKVNLTEKTFEGFAGGMTWLILDYFGI